MAGLNEKVSQPHENFSSTEKIETVKDVIDQLEKERDEQYPEDFLKWLEKKAPEVFEDLQKIDTNTLPEVHEAIATLDDQLTRWEAENAKPEKPSLDIEVARIYEYLEDVKDLAKKAALEASLDKAVKDYGFAKSYPMYMKQAEANLQTALKDIKDASKAPAAESPAAPSTETTEAPKRKTSSRSDVLKSLSKNPDALFSEEDGTYKMLFKKGSAAEKYLQIQDVVGDEYKNEKYYLQKDGDDRTYEWDGDKSPASFYASDGERLKIYNSDVVHVYKKGEKTPEKTDAAVDYAPADVMNVVWRDETLNPAKVEELIKTLDSKKGEFKNLNDKDLKRDDLISKIDLALASDQLSSTSRQKLESYRGQLDAYELQEDGKRSEKLSAAWEKEFANVAKIVDAAKAQNPNLEFNIESRGPHENNKIITLTDKVSGREAKVKITVWPLGKADYSPKGATMVWDTAREGGKNVMADVLYKKRLPKSYESVDELTRTAIEWVGKVDLKKVNTGVSKAPTSAPIAQQSSERAAEYVSTTGSETVADDFVPGEEILIPQPPETDGDYETRTETRPVAERAEPEEVAGEEELVRAGAEADTDTTASTDTVRDEETSPAGEEVIAAPGAEDTEEEDGEASAEPLEAPVYRGATLEEFEAKEAEIRDKYKLDGKITELNRSGEVYSFKYNDTAKVTVNPDGSLTVVKSFPDGKIETSVIPEDWRSGMDSAIDSMQPAAPREETETKAMDMDALDVPAGTARPSAAPETAVEDLTAKAKYFKEKYELKGNIEGITKAADGRNVYTLDYRGAKLQVNIDNTVSIFFAKKDAPNAAVTVPADSKNIDYTISQFHKRYPQLQLLDKSYEALKNIGETSADQLKKLYHLRGNIEEGSIVTAPGMNGSEITTFKYRGTDIRTEVLDGRTLVIIKNTDGETESFYPFRPADEPRAVDEIDQVIDDMEKFGPKKYVGEAGVQQFISEHGGKDFFDKLEKDEIFTDGLTVLYNLKKLPNGKVSTQVGIMIDEDAIGQKIPPIIGEEVVGKEKNIRMALAKTEKEYRKVKFEKEVD